MIEQDTIKLLRECDAGVKMGVASIDDVLPHVQRQQLQSVLNKCKDEHNKLQNEILEQLGKYGEALLSTMQEAAENNPHLTITLR